MTPTLSVLATYKQVDVVSEESVQKGIDACVKQFSVLSGVVQCAGIGGAQRVSCVFVVLHHLLCIDECPFGLIPTGTQW
jgi:NAD(P)-dependent dehydrogenase (short-subunit alcohol dehydrogenase family)